jgi:hypothetical protein
MEELDRERKNRVPAFRTSFAEYAQSTACWHDTLQKELALVCQLDRATTT